MPTVSNTSPLLNLAIIGELKLVRAQFSSVLIPPAVVEEFRLDTERPGTSTLSRALKDLAHPVQQEADPDGEGAVPR